MDKIFDLGGNWHVRWQRQNGQPETMVFVNDDTAERIELGADSIRTLRELFHIDTSR